MIFHERYSLYSNNEHNRYLAQQLYEFDNIIKLLKLKWYFFSINHGYYMLNYKRPIAVRKKEISLKVSNILI